ncbi:hypothetical protein VTN49DRAFT_2428 [Thermomyces lanuginosus]|uniref:uncharacterized protein n=1 Tax=Thermomyces lanuginosus TaxID=5541 RepID=UPI003742643F
MKSSISGPGEPLRARQLVECFSPPIADSATLHSLLPPASEHCPFPFSLPSQRSSFPLRGFTQNSCPPQNALLDLVASSIIQSIIPLWGIITPIV